MKTNRMRLENLVKLNQPKLFETLETMFSGNVLSVPGKYLLVSGSAPVLLVAHLDTVHRSPVRQIVKKQNGSVWSSPEGIGGDDRCGVYALLSVRESASKKPWLLFTCDEEIGALGAQRFCADFDAGKLPDEIERIKYIIEIDRKGRNDAVYYDCANADFEKHVNSYGFHTEYGSFSDISYLAPDLGIAAVNLSSGYYNPHTLSEYINLNELNETISKVRRMVEDSVKPEVPHFEYIRYSKWDYWDDEEDYNYPQRTFSDERIQEMYEELLTLYRPGEIDRLIDEYGEIAVEIIYRFELYPDSF